MHASQKLKLILYCFVYGINLLFALLLWLCGERGNILLGIFCILFYRLSLWSAPFAVTILNWIPVKPRLPFYKKLLHNGLLLLLCGGLFVVCYLLFGIWY